MDIKQEDLIRFWNWVGCERKPHPLAFDDDGKMWLYPDGFYMPNLPVLDLNNIYRYAIPKLQKMGYHTELTSYNDGITQARIFTIINVEKTNNVACVESKSPTEALYNAIMKVIDNEVK